MADRDDAVMENFYSRSQKSKEKLSFDNTHSKMQLATRYETMVSNSELDKRDPRSYVRNSYKPASIESREAARSARQYGSITYLSK